MTYEEMADERELLIGQGVHLPNLDDDYYNHDDQFDTFSCATGDYRAVPHYAEDDDTVTIKVESDIDSHYDSDTDTLCNDLEMSSRNEFSTASTVSQLQSTGNVPVVADAVGVNDEHEGMNYDLLGDGVESYEFHESIVQTGNIYPCKIYIQIINFSA